MVPVGGQPTGTILFVGDSGCRVPRHPSGICGMRVEEIEDPLMQRIRYLDKLVDELARGKSMEKILRAG